MRERAEQRGDAEQRAETCGAKAPADRGTEGQEPHAVQREMREGSVQQRICENGPPADAAAEQPGRLLAIDRALCDGLRGRAHHALLIEGQGELRGREGQRGDHSEVVDRRQHEPQRVDRREQAEDREDGRVRACESAFLIE